MDPEDLRRLNGLYARWVRLFSAEKLTKAQKADLYLTAQTLGEMDFYPILPEPDDPDKPSAL